MTKLLSKEEQYTPVEKNKTTESTPSINPELWIENYGDALYNFALMRLRNPDAAEEVVQEALVAAVKGQKSFQGRAAEKSWLIAILRHKIIDHIRKKSRETPVSDEDLEALTPEALVQSDGHLNMSTGTWADNPGNIVEQKEFLQTLYACVDKLPDKLNQVFSLREFDELEADEICKIMNISSSNLWVMLHRARLRLRKCIELNWFEDNGK